MPHSSVKASAFRRNSALSALQRIAREPLLHFLLAGAAIFVVYGLVARPDVASRSIVVDRAEIARLAERFRTQWQRPPSDDELRDLIDQHVDEEVLYREALALRLDDGDEIVRRRLAQKMQFMIEDTASVPRPTETDLAAYFDAHRADFATPAQRSFTHVFLRAERGPDAEQVAARVLATLAGVDRAPERGDPFMLRYDYADVTERDVATQFGAAFAARVFALPAGTWQGPVQSSYGYHLVRITRVQDEQPGDYAALHERIRAAWLEDARKRANATVLAAVKSRYRITVADVAAGSPTTALPAIAARQP